MAAAGLLLSCLAMGQPKAEAGGSVIDANPTRGRVPLRVMFTVSPISSGVTIDFGDGTTGELHPAPVCYTCPPLATASHVYERPGAYIARLVAGGRAISGGAVTVKAD